MLDPFILFLAVAAAWFVLRILARSWSAQKLERGELSFRGWAIVNATSWALMPLLAIPFMTDADTRTALLVLAAAMFLFQTAILLLARRFVERG